LYSWRDVEGVKAGLKALVEEVKGALRGGRTRKREVVEGREEGGELE